MLNELEKNNFTEFSTSLLELVRLWQTQRDETSRPPIHKAESKIFTGATSYTQISFSNDESIDILDMIMKMRSDEGMNIIEMCCFILFEKKDNSYLIFVLNEVPNVVKYFYKTNE